MSNAADFVSIYVCVSVFTPAENNNTFASEERHTRSYKTAWKEREAHRADSNDARQMSKSRRTTKTIIEAT